MRKVGILSVLLLLVAVSPAVALDKIPEKPGWHGFVLLGLGSQRVESNFIVGSSFKELGDEEIESVFEEPEAVSDGVPVISGELGYRFKSNTYLSAGNAMEDIIRYDFTSRISLRQGMGKAGVVEFELLFSSTPARVWEDPYLTGDERDATDRDSRGGRITWDRIGGSGLEIELTARNIDVETENSGVFLGLSASDQRLLERDGSMTKVRVSYLFKLAEHHYLVPRIALEQQDRDGDAVSYDQTGGDITYLYATEKVSIAGSLIVDSSAYDEDHPIYGEKPDSDGVGATLTALFQSWMPGLWTGGVTIATYNEDSDLDFYDASITSISLVTGRRW